MIEIRQYQEADLGAIKALMQQLQAHEKQLVASRAEPTEEYIARYIAYLLGMVAQHRGMTFVAVDGEMVCGFGAGFVEDELESDSEYFYISDLSVDAAYRGQGIGSKLMASLEVFARQGGFTSIHVAALTDNTRALDLYHKLGYSDYISVLIKPLGDSA